MKIILKTTDIKADRTDSGQLIDKIAMALDTWTEDDLYENNCEHESEATDYVLKEFDFEEAYIAYLNKLGKKAFEIADYAPRIIHWKESDLLAGAYIALNSLKFNENLEAYEKEIGDYWSMRDSDRMDVLAPGLWEEIEEAREYFWKNLKREWLHGDHYSHGIIGQFKKWLGGYDISADYDEKKDEMTITLSEDEAREFIGLDESEPMNAKRAKEAIIDAISDKMENNDDKRKAKNKKCAEERKAMAEYQAQRQAAAEAERVEKLRAMRR